MVRGLQGHRRITSGWFIASPKKYEEEEEEEEDELEVSERFVFFQRQGWRVGTGRHTRRCPEARGPIGGAPAMLICGEFQRAPSHPPRLGVFGNLMLWRSHLKVWTSPPLKMEDRVPLSQSRFCVREPVNVSKTTSTSSISNSFNQSYFRCESHHMWMPHMNKIVEDSLAILACSTPVFLMISQILQVYPLIPKRDSSPRTLSL